MEQEKLETELSEEQKNKLIKSVLIERGRVKDELLSNFDLDGLKKELEKKENVLSNLQGQDQELKPGLLGQISIIKDVISELEGGKTAQPEVAPATITPKPLRLDKINLETLPAEIRKTIEEATGEIKQSLEFHKQRNNELNTQTVLQDKDLLESDPIKYFIKQKNREVQILNEILEDKTLTEKDRVGIKANFDKKIKKIELVIEVLENVGIKKVEEAGKDQTTLETPNPTPETTPTATTENNEVETSALTEEEWGNFVDTGKVSEDVLNKIAKKIVLGQPSSKKEVAVVATYGKEIEALLNARLKTPTPEVATPMTTPEDLFTVNAKISYQGEDYIISETPNEKNKNKYILVHPTGKPIYKLTREQLFKQIENGSAVLVPPTPEQTTEVNTDKTPEQILDAEKKLDDARAKYAEEYKKFLASTGKIARAKRFVFGGKIEDSEIPPELKELEKEYEKATVEYGNTMFSAKKTKNEIFTKVIIEEQIKLNSLKVENLPPKEKNIIRKGLGWYLNPETPRWKKLLVSTALGTAAVYAVSGTTIAAAGGVMYYAGLRLTRATVGAVMGQGANKIFDKLVKDKSSAKREAEEKELAELFKEETFDVSLAKSKKEYAEILEREQKAKRNRLITKAMIGLAVGVGTSIGMSYGIGHLAHSASDQLHEGNLKTKVDTETPESIKTESITTGATETIKPEEVPLPAFQNECVTFEKGKGAIQGILDLKNQIREQYHGDYTNMPKSVQDFMNTDATKEAMRLGLFDPENPSGEESALIQEGSMLKFDKDGNLLFGKPDAGGNIPILEKYEGKMFDSDGSRKVLPVENTTESEGMIKMPEEGNMRNYQKIVGVESVEKETPENTSLEDISEKEDKTESIRKEIFDKMEQRRPNTIKTGTRIGIGGAVEPGRGPGGANYFWDSRFQNMNIRGPQYYFPGLSPDENDFLNHHPEFANNPFHLDGETLVRALKVHGHNVEHIFKDRDEWESFSNLKAKNWVHFGKISEDSDPKLIYLNKLATITGTKPRGWTLLYGKAETNGEYIARALQKAAEVGKLDQLKIKE